MFIICMIFFFKKMDQVIYFHWRMRWWILKMMLHGHGSLNSLKNRTELDKTCVLCRIKTKAYGKGLLLYILNPNIMPAYGTWQSMCWRISIEILKIWRFYFLHWQFETIMERIYQIDTHIRSYLFDIGYSKWSRSYSNCKRTWTMISNIAESLNNVNKLARRLPVISLLVFMRVTIQRWIHKHNEEADKTTSDLTKKYDLYLQKSIALSCNMRVCVYSIE